MADGRSREQRRPLLARHQADRDVPGGEVPEFNGLLEFDFRPWQREDVVVGKDEEDMLSRVPKLHPRPFTGQGPTLYKGVFIQNHKPPHEYLGWPKEENVVRVWWWEKPKYVQVNEAQDKRVEGRAYPVLDNFVITFCRSSWPNLFDSMRVLESDEQAHPGERSHRLRLFNATANLLYFLAAENVVRVKIRPEHHDRHGRDLAGLPKSNREYHVLPFQLPRYRYLHKDSVEPTGRRVSCCFDVRGHSRHLRDERFKRKEDGTVRVIWIPEHQKGMGNPYQPSIRRGTIDSLFLDYDKFIREETARVARRKKAS